MMRLHLISMGILFISLSTVVNSYNFQEFKGIPAVVAYVYTSYFVQSGLLHSDAISSLLNAYDYELKRVTAIGQKMPVLKTVKLGATVIDSFHWMDALRFGIVYKIFHGEADSEALEAVYIPATINIEFDAKSQYLTFKIVKVGDYRVHYHQAVQDLKTWHEPWKYPVENCYQNLDGAFWRIVADYCIWNIDFKVLELPIFEFTCDEDEKVELLNFVTALVETSLKSSLKSVRNTMQYCVLAFKKTSKNISKILFRPQ